MRTFRKLAKWLLPWWLTTEEGERVAHSLALLLDAFRCRLWLSARARFPQHCPPDALQYLGRDRQIVRGIDEMDASYGARLIPWLDHHRVRGNPFALLEQLRAYCNVTDGVLARTVDRRSNWFTIAADGTRSYLLDQGNWDWDDVAATPRWARGWVILYMTGGTEPFEPGPDWGDVDLWGGAWGTPGYTWGTTATPGQIAALRSIVHAWKPGGTMPQWIILAFDPASFNPASPEPDGTWGNWSVAGVAARLDTARYVSPT